MPYKRPNSVSKELSYIGHRSSTRKSGKKGGGKSAQIPTIHYDIQLWMVKAAGANFSLFAFSTVGAFAGCFSPPRIGTF